jgi:hypothetical protein
MLTYPRFSSTSREAALRLADFGAVWQGQFPEGSQDCAVGPPRSCTEALDHFRTRLAIQRGLSANSG